jgi:HPt (histidine-containing phosphotransfer) domain-containing protein
MTMTIPAQPGGGAEADAGPDKSTGPDLSAALDKVWVRFLPEIRVRIGILDAAVAAYAAGAMTSEEREAAHSAAHKLAGTLGTFNLAHGTKLAREFELLFAEDCVPDSASARRLASLAAELRVMVDGRPANAG